MRTAGGRHEASTRRVRPIEVGAALLILAVLAALLSRVSSSGAVEPAPQPVPPLKSVWSAGMAEGGSGFQDTPWENDPLPPAFDTGPLRGDAVGRYAIPAFGSRCENVADFATFREGQEFLFTFSTYLTPEVPLDTAEWQVLAQWKNDGLGSPPLSLAVTAGRYELTGGYGWPGVDNPAGDKLSTRDLGSAGHSTWDRWVVRVRFSSDPAKGSVDLWRNGEQIVRQWHPEGGTLYPGRDSYLKVGYYRSSQIGQYAEVLHRDWTIGVPATAAGT